MHTSQDFHPPSLLAMLLPQHLSVCTMYRGASEIPPHQQEALQLQQADEQLEF
jgi:hypothetical protein